ncbi:MAG: hypothetical protein WBZ36_09070 [Candidatus Nitrosopolaris sp.]
MRIVDDIHFITNTVPILLLLVVNLTVNLYNASEVGSLKVPLNKCPGLPARTILFVAFWLNIISGKSL